MPWISTATGVRNIWTHDGADVFASIANYLGRLHWRPDQTWGRAVRLPPGINSALIGLKIEKPLPSGRGWASATPTAAPCRGRIAASLVAPMAPPARPTWSMGTSKPS